MLLTILLCSALIGLDQLIKLWAVKNLAPIGTIPFIPHVLELSYVENTGAAFSLFSGQKILLLFLTGAMLLVIAFFLLLKRPKTRLEYMAGILIFSGGAGNWIDRFFNGFVVDYFSPIFINFAVFNFADILVCTGVALLALSIIKTDNAKH